MFFSCFYKLPTMFGKQQHYRKGLNTGPSEHLWCQTVHLLSSSGAPKLEASFQTFKSRAICQRNCRGIHMASQKKTRYLYDQTCLVFIGILLELICSWGAVDFRGTGIFVQKNILPENTELSLPLGLPAILRNGRRRSQRVCVENVIVFLCRDELSTATDKSFSLLCNSLL